MSPVSFNLGYSRCLLVVSVFGFLLGTCRLDIIRRFDGSRVCLVDILAFDTLAMAFVYGKGPKVKGGQDSSH